MTLAVIADIHGNASALSAVLADLPPGTPLYVNGDVVNRGPDSVEVTRTLLDWPGAQFVLGNHDDLMLLWTRRSEQLKPDWFTDPFWKATDWSARALESAGLLSEFHWPMTRRIHGADWGAAGDVLLAHGTPEHYREGLERNLSDERAAQLLSGGVSVLVGSHTHWPMLRELGGRRLVNTGAVGAPFNGDSRAQYLLLRISGGQWQPELRAVPYDRAPVLARYESSGLLTEGGLSAHIFREELRLARSLYTPYWLWTQESERERSPQTWAEFLALHPEYGTAPL